MKKSVICLFLSLSLLLSFLCGCSPVSGSTPVAVPSYPTIPVNESVPATGIKDCAMAITNASIYPNADPFTMSVGQLTAGERVAPTQLTHNGDITMLRISDGWVKLSDLMFDGCSTSGIIPCTVVTEKMNVRTGPSIEHTIVGAAYTGDKFFLKSFTNSDVSGNPWAMTNDGRWLFVDYLAFPNGITYLKGTNNGAAFPSEGTGTQAQPTTPSQSNPPQQAVQNTALVGHWADLSSLQDDLRYIYVWSFHSNGEFEYTIYLSSYDSGQLTFYPGVQGKTGTYSYDGSTLTLNFKTHFDPNPNGPEYVNYTEVYSATASDSSITMNGNKCLKVAFETGTSYTTAFSCLLDYICSQCPGLANEQLFKEWKSEAGDSVTLHPNGAFEATTANGQSYNGYFYCGGSSIYFIFNNKTYGSTGEKYVHEAYHTLNGGVLCLDSVSYTAANE